MCACILLDSDPYLINFSVGTSFGLSQEDFAREKEKRLVERARMAPILSLGF